MHNETEWVLRLLAAFAAGALIGIERQIRGKAAGLKTLVFISVGSCLFMIISEIVGASEFLTGHVQYVSDPGRIAAQVVTGIGFIGAGVIVQSKAQVHGLTTAAVIWATAGVGMLIGIGYKVFGLLVALFLVIILVILHLLEIGPFSKWYHQNENLNQKKKEKLRKP